MIPDTWSEAAPDLLPVLRGTWAPTASWRTGWRDPLGALPRIAVAPFLDALVVWDSPQQRRYLQRRHLARWGVSAAQALGRALSHLPESEGLTRRPDGLWSFEPGDGYETSRPLLPGWLGSFEGEVPGRPLLAMPHARCVLVGGSEELSQVAALHDAATRGFHTEGEPLSPVLYTLGERGGISVWRPGQAHPLGERLSLAERALAMYAYRRQDEELEERGEPFARCQVLSNIDPRLACVWTEGTTPLLPEVEWVVLRSASGQRRVPFGELALDPVEGWRPARWRGEWPEG
ncbi:MAG: hypothetical protein H6741_16230 [Alphaproteobacteria bacterium]|nr:hypothetical protein [Alphaproteobacteria bacterium]MCB9794262.1 hypothetical protein [Alphaproteobacteria bacterium]